MFTLGFFLWNVLGNVSLRADRGGPQRRKLECGTTAERCLPGRKRGKGEGIMNENVDSLMIRLVGLQAGLDDGRHDHLYGPFPEGICKGR